jgi:Ca2+-binding EF-hand superfamily protein
MCCLGILHIVVGYRTSTKLKAVRKSFYPEPVLRQKFNKADSDGDGGLDLNEFRALCINLGMDLNGRETEVAFRYMTDVDKLRYESFRDWWNASDVESQLMDSNDAFILM